MKENGKFQYKPVAPKKRLHGSCRYCRCTPGEFGEEVCRVCGTVFSKTTHNQGSCSKECTRKYFSQRYEMRLKQYCERDGVPYYPKEVRSFRAFMLRNCGAEVIFPKESEL